MVAACNLLFHEEDFEIFDHSFGKFSQSRNKPDEKVNLLLTLGKLSFGDDIVIFDCVELYYYSFGAHDTSVVGPRIVEEFLFAKERLFINSLGILEISLTSFDEKF